MAENMIFDFGTVENKQEYIQAVSDAHGWTATIPQTTTQPDGTTVTVQIPNPVSRLQFFKIITRNWWREYVIRARKATAEATANTNVPNVG